MSRIRMLALVCLLLPLWAHAQAYQPLINPHAQYLDVNGKPLANGKIFTYVAGTTTKAATFTDSSGATSNSNPVITDSAGFATIYLDTSKSYKIVLQNANGVQQWIADNVTGGVPSSGGGGGMIYPAAGIANSNGTGWGTSYSATNTIPANFVSTLNQSTTGNAATATALATTPSICPSGQFAQGILATGNATGCAAGGGSGMIWPPPSASGVIPSFNGAGGWLTSYNNANPIPANFISTLNQNTTGTAANITGTSNSTLTTLSALSLPYGQLSGTVPTWNQNTTGNAATATGMSTSGTANQVWGMDPTGSTQGWQTAAGGSSLVYSTTSTGTLTTSISTITGYPITMVTPSVNTDYRFEFELKQTNTPACTTYGTLQVKLAFTDADNGAVVGAGTLAGAAWNAGTATTSFAMGSAIAPANTFSGSPYYFNAKGGVAVTLTVTQSVASVSCTTFPTFLLKPALFTVPY